MVMKLRGFYFDQKNQYLFMFSHHATLKYIFVLLIELSMKKIFYYLWLTIRALIGYAIVGIVGLICFIPCFIIAALPARWRYDNKIYYFFVKLFYNAGLKATFLPVDVEGLENMPKEPVIFVANHQSALDIPVLGSLIGCYPHVWLFYVRYAKLPIFGFIARRMNIVIDPSGLRKLVTSLDKAVQLVEGKNRHVMIFPEGGRFVDGTIHKFFYGFAVLAKKLQRPVIPVLMKNLGKIYPPGSFFVYPDRIKVIIGKPMHFMPDETEDAFLDRVHGWFVENNGEGE